VLKYNGTKFAPSTGASVTISDTAPTSPTPQAGDQWYESDTGRTFIYYDSVWVEIGSTATTNVNANDLSGTTLASNVVSSSLTSVGTITNLQATAATINGWTVSQPGLVLVKTQTVGTAVSSVEVTSAFSSSYDNYLVTLGGGTASSDCAIGIHLGSSQTAYHGFLNYGSSTSSTPVGATINNSTVFNFAGGASAGNQAHLSVQLIGPNLAAYTKFVNAAYANGLNFGTAAGEHRVATAYTSFTLTPSAGTLTGGTIRVYGYRNS
jgi:hypothetical protein